MEVHYNFSIFSLPTSYSGCCWISLSHYAGSSGWKVETAINLAPRSDNGKINSSPVTRSPAIVRFPGGCRQSFRIPVEDPDGDTVKCRFATYSESLKVNTSFPYGEMDEVIEGRIYQKLKWSYFIFIFFNTNTNKFYSTRQYNVIRCITYKTAYLH